MANPQSNLITVVDLGSSETRVLVAEVADGALRYRGHGIARSAGMRKGVIMNLADVAASIHEAAEQAEQSAEVVVDRATVGIGGSHIKGINSHGAISLGSRPRDVRRDDVRTATDTARSISLPADRDVLHLLPQEFICDEQPGIQVPEGINASKLEAFVHLVTASASITQNVVTVLNRASIHVEDTVFEALAAADSVLGPDERELGVCLVDIGAGSSEFVVYHEGAVMHTGGLPIGGDHFTNDLALGLACPTPDAERLKCQHGNAVETLIAADQEVEVPSTGERPSRMLPRRALGEILEARAREMFEMLRDSLRQAGWLDRCASGIVLTGGGAQLEGIADVAESVLHKPVRLALPVPLQGMPDELRGPEFATVLGMVPYAYRARLVRFGEPVRWSERVRAWLARKGA
jgi:cell division protein FtsA